jgi:hypothetical protein
LSAHRAHWVGTRPSYFPPVPVPSLIFRGKFLEGLRAAHAAGRLQFAGDPPDLTARNAHFAQLVSGATRSDFVVYANCPFGGPEVVLKYLAPYTDRAAIKKALVLDFENGFACCRYRGRAQASASAR